MDAMKWELTIGWKRPWRGMVKPSLVLSFFSHTAVILKVARRPALAMDVVLLFTGSGLCVRLVQLKVNGRTVAAELRRP